MKLQPFRAMTLLDQLRDYLLPPSGVAPLANADLFHARERILTGLLRTGTILGTVTFAIAILPAIRDSPARMYQIAAFSLAITWISAIYRSLPYALRGGLLLSSLYFISLSELLHYGYSQDAIIYFALFSLLCLLFFGPGASTAALIGSEITLAAAGWAISTGRFIPLALNESLLKPSTALMTCLIFLLSVGTIQAGIVLLFNSLQDSLRREHQVRMLLEHERELLEQRVAERTQELAKLHQNTLVLMQHRETERARAENAMRQQAFELQAHNAELDSFARTVAHDLKTPLTGLIGSIQLLQIMHETLASDERETMINTMVSGASKMNRIIDALLLLARVRTLDAVPTQELVMTTIIEDVEARLDEEIGASLAVIRKPQTWPPAIGYAPWIEEVWVNYLSNAIKYSGLPPQISLGATPTDNGFIRFWVQDNGQTLSADQQVRLFTAFTRLHVTNANGHGLGLSIVHQIISKLGGEVGVTSMAEQGNTFYFTLPAP